MTVFLLISSEGYFGAENMVVTLGAVLTQLGCRCILGVFHNTRCHHTEVGDQAHKRGLTVEILPCNGRFDWHTVANIRKILGKYSVNILHAHGYKADAYAYAAAWSHRAGLVATCHNWPSRLPIMRAYAALDRLLLRGFERVVVISDPVAQILLRSGIRSEKLETIFNGVETERFRGAKPTLKSEIASTEDSLVGYVGRLVPEKGGEILLRAGQQVLRTRPRVKLVLVGDGPARKDWELLAEHLAIRDRVIFAGMREDMPGVYASFQLLVLPSLSEAMPMCLLESMAAGKPIIATRVGAVPKLVLTEQTGLLVDPCDVDGLAAAMIRVLNDEELGRRLGENGYTYATRHFSADAMARRYLRLYEEVVSLNQCARKPIVWGMAE